MKKDVLNMLCQIPFDVISPLQNNSVSQFPMENKIPKNDGTHKRFADRISVYIH
jgi:hypothetical protein